MTKPSILRFAPVAVLLALLPLTLPGQEEKPPGAQGEADKRKDAAKPITLQAALPVAEKAFAKEGLKATEWMLTGAVYLGDKRIFGAKPPFPSDFLVYYNFIEANQIKLPVWVFTYSQISDQDVNNNTAYAGVVLTFVGPNKEATMMNGAPPSSAPSE